MAESIKIRVEQTGAEAAEAALLRVQKVADDLNRTPVKVKVEGGASTELDRFTRSAGGAAAGADSVNNAVLQFVKWHVAAEAVRALTDAVGDALDEMKRVDTALIDVQKTTDFTDAQIGSLTKKMYDLAQEYGRTASELTNSAASFARAGFGDQLDTFVELSALLQNVGDLTEEQASKFLIAENASWGLNGSYSDLLETIDGLNNMTNHAAVDMETLTSAITVAGAALASSGESVQTFSALVGTAAAVTQRSGAEIGRAFRTINSRVQQVKGNLGGGEIVSAEDISNAAKALESVGISVRGANGELRLTSDILGELAGKWDGLNSLQKSYVSQQLAGIRQANVLAAVLENWSEVERQMELYASGAGSALRENEIYLDSWEAKTKQLNAAWSELVSHLADTGAIKVGLDAAIAGVDLLDTGLGRAAISGAATAVAINGIIAALAALKVFAATAAGGAILAGLLNPAGLAIGGTVAVAALLYETYRKLNPTVEDYKSKIAEANEEEREAQSELDRLNAALQENQKRLMALNNLGGDPALKERLENENDRLLVQIGLQQKAIETARQKAAEDAKAALQAKSYQTDMDEYGNFQTVDIIEYTQRLLDMQKAGEDVEEELDGLISTIIELQGSLDTTDPEAQALYVITQALITAWRALNPEWVSAAKGIAATSDAAGAFYRNADDLEKQVKAVSAALKDFKSYDDLTTDSINALGTAIPGLLDALYDEEGRLTDAGKAALETAANLDTNRAAVEYLQMAADRLSMQNAINEFYRLSDAAQTAAQKAVALQNLLVQLGGTTNGRANIDSRAIGEAIRSGQATSLEDYLNQLINANTQSMSDYAAAHTKSTGTSSARSSSSSSGSGRDAELERRKQAVADEKAVYELMVKQGKSAAELEAQIRKVQDALHQQRLRMEELKESTSDQLALSAEWWTWDEKRLQNYEKEQKAAEDAAKQQLAVYQQNVTINQKQLQIVQAIGAGSNAELAVSRKLTASYSELLAQQQAQGASQDDIYATALNLIKAKKDELSLEQSITEEIEAQAEKQRELDEKYISDTVKLRKSDVDLAQKLGLSTEEIVYYMRRYADAIAEQGRAMQASGAAQADINALAVTYLGVLEDIYDLENGEAATEGQDRHLKFLKDVVSLRNSELSLMEAMELSDDEQVRKYRGILDALKAQGDYQKQINAAQEEQNKTATDYYNTLQKILSLQKSQLDDLRDAAIVYLDEQEAAATGPLQEQLDLLKAQHDEAKAQREEDEKLLSVEKARQSLENAKKPIGRVWNREKGIWEQLADASAVESAEEALLKAQEELAEYQYQLQIDALQSEIDALEKTFDTMRDAIEDAAEGIKNGEYTYEEAYQYIASQMKALYDGFSAGEKTVYDNHNAALTEAMNGAVTPFRDVAGEIQTTYNQIKTTALSFGEIDSVLTEKSEELSADLDRLRLSLSDGFGALGTDLDRADYLLQDAEDELENTVDLLSLLPASIRSILEGLGAAANDVQRLSAGGGDVQRVIEQMRANSIAWHNDAANRAYYEAENQRLGASIGATYRNGAWYGSDGNLLYDITGYTGNTSHTVETPVQVSGGSASSVYASDPDDRDGNGVPDWLDMVSPSDGGGGAGGYDPFAAPTQTQSYADLDAESEIRRIMSQYGADYSYARRLYELNLARGYAAYDQGGVLRGMGGIKAVREDELILPPDLTKAILKPGLTETVAARLNELGILTGARNAAGTLNLRAGNTIGTQNNYSMNAAGVDMRHITEGTTMGEVWRQIVAQSRTLEIY